MIDYAYFYIAFSFEHYIEITLLTAFARYKKERDAKILCNKWFGVSYVFCVTLKYHSVRRY